MLRLFPGLLVIIILVSCGGSQNGSHKDTLVQVSDEDPLMAAAFKQAKAEFTTFEENLGKAGVYCAMKVGFEHKDSTEYCWIGRVTKVEGSADEYRGILDSDPEHDIGHKAGDTVTVKRERISDWIVKEKTGPAKGNFTLKALFPNMTPEEVAAAKKAMRWD
jgi:uncharacterized protein YegJ (DUF2314 family)